MKAWKRVSVLALTAIAFILPSFAVNAKSAEAATTGYTKASDVVYKKSGSYILNWGARDEDCVFLSTYAEDFYTGSYIYETMSKKTGGTSQTNAKNSDLYKELKSLMTSKHKYVTSYAETRYQYCYTDCEKNDSSKISSFYSGVTLSGTWDRGATWNREHTWPKSKCINKSEAEDSADMMTLRPTSVSENSSRGNKAYGESSGYYDPNGEGRNVRGDCARIVLYGYTRWGNTSYMWGLSGVMESLNVLLEWMEEDPVDTWEMGRNDAVQSITGTRNVFVDYPEYAWLLFGREIPEDMVTPSGIASGETPPASSEESSSEEIILPDSSDSLEEDSEFNSSMGGSNEENCAHEFSKWITMKEPTETELGERRRICMLCNHLEKESIPALGGEENCAHEFSKWITMKEPTETESGERRRICMLCNHLEKESIPMLGGEESSVNGNTGESGCAASVGTSVGGVVFTLMAYAFLEKMRKRQTK